MFRAKELEIGWEAIKTQVGHPINVMNYILVLVVYALTMSN